METRKTAEEVLGETYAALLGSGKNHIIEAMEVYAQQARRKEQAKHNELLRYINDDIVGSWINGNPKNNLNRLFEQAGYKAGPSGYEIKEENTK